MKLDNRELTIKCPCGQWLEDEIILSEKEGIFTMYEYKCKRCLRYTIISLDEVTL